MIKDYEWWGVIGPAPHTNPAGWIMVPHDPNAALDTDYHVGPVHIRPGDRQFTEYLRSEPRSLVGVACFESRPVIVEGDWPGNLIATEDRYESLRAIGGQQANERLANSWLYRTAALLALVFNGEPWQVRNAATDRTRFPAAVPDDWSAPPMSPIGSGGDVGLIERSLPSTLTTAWERLDEDDALARALTSWHQGQLLATLFPSYAHIAYCAAIETMAQAARFRGQINVEAVKCPTCENVPKAATTFWATVSLVRDAAEVEELRSQYDPYGARSGTAHRSVTHGIEDSFGYEHMMKYVAPRDGQPGGIFPDENDSTQAFMWRTLPEFQRITSELISSALIE